MEAAINTTINAVEDHPKFCPKDGMHSTKLKKISTSNYARYKNTATGEVTEYKSAETIGVFVFAGYAPATEALKGIVQLNEHGYIVTDAT